MEMHLDREILEDPTQFALIVFHLSTALLHTQEVTGSSPVVSTKQFLITQEIRNCSFALRLKSYVKFFIFSLTNTRLY